MRPLMSAATEEEIAMETLASTVVALHEAMMAVTELWQSHYNNNSKSEWLKNDMAINLCFHLSFFNAWPNN